MGDWSPSLRRLWLLSLGLPGMQDVLAQDFDDQLSYRFTLYAEDDLPAARVIAGDTRRYRIESHQLRYDRDWENGFKLRLGFLHEAMSGASPWYVFPDPERGPLQVMSGATIREHRDDFNAALSRETGRTEHGVLLGYSTEDDYEARYASYQGEYSPDDEITTWSWGLSLSEDDLSPTDALLFGRVEEAHRNSRSASMAVARVVNRNLLLQAGVSLTRQQGFLADPYKQVWVGNGPVNDRRPDERTLVAFTLRGRQFVEATGGALHADYRYFADDWSVRSHTLAVSWHQPLTPRLDLVPALRYHGQEAASFYDTAFAALPAEGHASSDYRLATFGALSYKLGLNFREERWQLSLDAEYYDSRESLALSGREFDTPGLASFWRLSLGLVTRW